MKLTVMEEEAVRQLASAIVGLLSAVRDSGNDRLASELRRAVGRVDAAERNNSQGAGDAKPLLLDARQAAKALAISVGTLFNYTAPRGPIPAIKIGTRVCYAVADLERAIELMKVKPNRDS